MDKNKYKVLQPVELQKIPTLEPIEDAEKKLKKVRKKIADLQNTMYAEGKYSALICLQGMDTSGKDSLIREVFKQFNVRGVEVYSFKVPTEKELKHDFLWRHYIALPAKGKVGVFNRTHYENVLVTRVHPEYVFSENIPSVNSLEDLDDDFYYRRMERINQFEKHVADNGTIILKFFLHLSKTEQKNRLLRRLDIPEKNWKFSAGDLKERKLWDKYQECYEDVINRTSTEYAPWFIVPADDKPTARFIVANTIFEEFKKYKFKEPVLEPELMEKLDEFKTQLHNE
ncbi:PPK2 family polyphosphate:nucleotide phosphotransferase [Tenacibaculum skagerrakense]|uniref:PPK2 family polyphosphate:nucleotide phosphotransferase n=1 Tax=Tenacibaculum skagerrakense TaxID=186571 RepID=A0A4R2NZM5_9FLAO|nr:PPK2 family polyphosphate kinase [Tenacibaculum skagerrakense]TCP26991.1 PPK2 family polyphosphate:nucleotide phosphotransferase [Tenacibaculum skagerrakense]